MISVNGQQYTDEQFAQAASIAVNTVGPSVNSASDVYNRGDLMKYLGRQYSGDRDVYEVLGYPEDPELEDFRARYERQDVAERIVKLPADDTWKHEPEVVDNDDQETQFQQDIRVLADEHQMFHYLRRADRVSGIGEYGLLFIGFADGAPLSEPVNASSLSSPDDVAYFSPFAHDFVNDWQLGKDQGLDPSDPRYNKPIRYEIDFSNPDEKTTDFQWVHHERVIHITEDRNESDIKGTPRLKPVLNRLIDREKVIGASAEMFWAGADRKLQFDVKSENTSDIPEDELSALDDEVQKLVHDLQNYIKTFNTDIEVIEGQEVDPSGVLDAIDKSIAGQTGIPKRILVGSERGELASSQDRATWYGRIEARQNRSAEPGMLRPLIDRFREFGVVAEPDGGTYEVNWPNLFELNEIEKSEVMNNRAEALERISPQGNTILIGTPEQLYDFITDGQVPDFDDFDPLPLDRDGDTLQMLLQQEGGEMEMMTPNADRTGEQS